MPSDPMPSSFCISPRHQLLVAVDTLVEGIHFFADVDADALGYKSLAVNLSDIAAMGGTPVALALDIHYQDKPEQWLDNCINGLDKLAARHGLQRLSTRIQPGPTRITVQISGQCPDGQAILRSGASPGDPIFVTGTLGDAALGLLCRRGIINVPQQADEDTIMQRLERPIPRLQAGKQLPYFASSCIDISDGLVNDLGHILEQSQYGAIIELEQVPLSPAMLNNVTSSQALTLALTGGDDYELCFTVAKNRMTEFQDRLEQMHVPVTRIGQIVPDRGLQCMDGNGNPVTVEGGFDHFL